MPKFKTFKIPGDYVEGETEWMTVMLCIPNTREWRAVVDGSIYNLTRGRNWDERTGIVKVAQVLGQRIYGSMTMDCNQNWEAIATALTSLDEKTPGLITLNEFLSDLGNSTIGDIADWLEFGTAVGGLLPNIDIKLSPVDWVRFLTDFFWKRNMLAAVKDLVTTEKIENFIQGGETVAEGAEALDGWVDDVADWAGVLLSGGNVTAEFLQAYAQLRGLFTADGANDDDALRNLNRVYNDVFVEGDSMAVNVNNQQTVNCGGVGGSTSMGGCGGTPMGGGFIPDTSPTGSVIDAPDYSLPGGLEPPPGFESSQVYQEYKCKAANMLALNIAESIYQVWNVKQADLNQASMTLTITTIQDYLMSLKGAVFEWVGYKSSTMLAAVVGWIADPVAVRIFDDNAPNDMDILYDIRIQMLDNRQDVVCALYNAASVGEAKTNLESLIDGYISEMSYAPEVDGFAMVITDAILCNTYLETLFTEDYWASNYEDTSAIDCALCSEYQYLTGTCTASDVGCTNPEDGDGQDDGVYTDQIDTDGHWRCQLDTPLVVTSGMTLEINARLSAGTYANWRYRVQIDSTWYTFRSLNTIAVSGWEGGSIEAYLGQTITDVELAVYDPGPGQDPNFIVDGLRLGGWQQ